jgi:hypothetical protein
VNLFPLFDLEEVGMDVEGMTRQIDERLGELRDEIGRLEQARAALTGTGTPTRRRGPGRPRGSRTRSRDVATGSGSGRRGRRRGTGTRAVEALAIVRQQPGVTIPELAEKMGIKQNYLYRVMPTLAGEGKVRKQDKGWFPVE